jgi:haloalkane dehalogenase
MSEVESRFKLQAGQFPFRSHFLQLGNATLHYVDEGQGPTLLMLHGNPTWSFIYRKMISALNGEFRCVAIDLAGFGLSKAPDNFSHQPDDHARLIADLIEDLDLHDVTLVAHDWGGPIGLSAMLKTGTRVTRLCLGNTWAWPVNGDFHFEWFSRLMGGPFGRLMSERFALFVNGMMPMSMKRGKLGPFEMAAYRAPFRDGQSRRPMYIFPQQITAAQPWLAELEEGVKRFKGPVKFIWPMNDIAFRDKELKKWLAIFPDAEVTRLESCGHYLWEDAPEDCVEALLCWSRQVGGA